MKKTLIALIGCLSISTVYAEGPNSKTTTENYGDWQVACIESSEINQCEMKQSLANQGGQLVSVLSIAKQGENTVVQIALPHLLDLTIPLSLSVDGESVASLPYKFCNRSACFVVLENDETVVGAFRKGLTGALVAKIVDGSALNLTYSLDGFSSALSNLPRNE